MSKEGLLKHLLATGYLPDRDGTLYPTGGGIRGLYAADARAVAVQQSHQPEGVQAVHACDGKRVTSHELWAAKEGCGAPLNYGSQVTAGQPTFAIEGNSLQGYGWPLAADDAGSLAIYAHTACLMQPSLPWGEVDMAFDDMHASNYRWIESEGGTAFCAGEGGDAAATDARNSDVPLAGGSGGVAAARVTNHGFVQYTGDGSQFLDDGEGFTSEAAFELDGSFFDFDNTGSGGISLYLPSPSHDLSSGTPACGLPAQLPSFTCMGFDPVTFSEGVSRQIPQSPQISAGTSSHQLTQSPAISISTGLQLPTPPFTNSAAAVNLQLPHLRSTPSSLHDGSKGASRTFGQQQRKQATEQALRDCGLYEATILAGRVTARHRLIQLELEKLRSGIEELAAAMVQQRGTL